MFHETTEILTSAMANIKNGTLYVNRTHTTATDSEMIQAHSLASS